MQGGKRYCMQGVECLIDNTFNHWHYEKDTRKSSQHATGIQYIFLNENFAVKWLAFFRICRSWFQISALIQAIFSFLHGFP